MTDCGCEKAKAELEEFLHNELSRGELDDIVEHLASCRDCEGEHHVDLQFQFAPLEVRSTHAPLQSASPGGHEHVPP